MQFPKLILAFLCCTCQHLMCLMRYCSEQLPLSHPLVTWPLFSSCPSLVPQIWSCFSNTLSARQGCEICLNHSGRLSRRPVHSPYLQNLGYSDPQSGCFPLVCPTNVQQKHKFTEHALCAQCFTGRGSKRKQCVISVRAYGPIEETILRCVASLETT